MSGRLILYLTLTMGSLFAADSISVTTPSSGDVVTGGYGYNSVYQFQVAYSGADIVKVCYTVDAYAAYNPGTDAAGALGCSMRAPYRHSFNSLWYLNGPHQVLATACSALGSDAACQGSGTAVAASAAVPFSTSNPLPYGSGLTYNYGMTVATSTPTTSNWSGAVTITPTFSGALAGTDSLTVTYLVDGIIQGSVTGTAPAAGTIYTTQFQNGNHAVGISVKDNTVTSPYGGAIGNTWIAGTNEWSRMVNFQNSTIPTTQAALNALEIYLSNASPTFTLSALILNTDGTTSAPSVAPPVYALATVWTAGSLNNTGINPINIPASGVVTVNSSTGVITQVGNGTALVGAMAPTCAINDLVIGSFGTRAFSASNACNATLADIGKFLYITGGTGFAVGVCQIADFTGTGQWLLGPGGGCVIGTAGTTGGSAYIGPTRTAWVHSWTTNTYPSFNSGGGVNAVYNPSTSMYVNSQLKSLTLLQNELPYNSPAPNCLGAPTGVACDYNNSGYNTFETGLYNLTIRGTESASTWTTGAQSFPTTLSNNSGATGCNAYPKFRCILIGSNLVGGSTSIWGMTYGNESSPTYINGSMTAMQYVVQQLINTGWVLGISWLDEINGTWGKNPLQGPLTPSANGTIQSPLINVVASSNVCTATFTSSTGEGNAGLIADSLFLIHGSGISGLDNIPASATATASGSTVTVTMTNQGSGYVTSTGGSFTPSITCSLSGGGGTYTSCTPTISTGSITAIAIAGASGYSSNPTVSISESMGSIVTVGPVYAPTTHSGNSWVWQCPGVANGTYNASTAPGMTLEPYGDIWQNGGTTYADFTVWSRLMNQAYPAAGNNLWFSAPTQGASTPISAFANYMGNQHYPGIQSINGVFSPASVGDLYYPQAFAPYLASRQAGIGIFNVDNGGYFFRSLNGNAYDPTIPYLGLTTGEGTYFGFQGYNASVTSCAGNVITFSGPHGLTNIIPGLTRLYITGATDATGPSPQDSCSNNFMVAAILSPTTLLVDLAATDFSSSTITTTGSSVATFDDANTMTLASGTNQITAKGTPSSTQIQQTHYIDGDPVAPAIPSLAYYRERGRTFTLSGITGTTTPKSTCLNTANCNFTSGTFRLVAENLNLASLPPSNLSSLAYRQIPSLNATGGTSTIIPDYSYHVGFSGRGIFTDENPQWAFLSAFEQVFTHASGQRVYGPYVYFSGYSDQLGFSSFGATGNTFQSNQVNTQIGENEHFEDAATVPDFHAISFAALEESRDAKFFLTPRLPSPDCTFAIDCLAGGGAAGNIFAAVNITDGPKMFTTPSLLSYQTSGQSFACKTVGPFGIGPVTTYASGTSTVTQLLPDAGSSLVCTFPVSFGGELLQPSISARLADVPGAATWAIRFAYNVYYLKTAGSTFSCGSVAVCTPPIDQNIGPVYYQLLFLNSSGVPLATSDVQQF